MYTASCVQKINFFRFCQIPPTYSSIHISGLRFYMSLDSLKKMLRGNSYITLCQIAMYIRGFTKFQITVACGLKFHLYQRMLGLKFQKARTKLKFSCLCPIGCLSLVETANRAETGKIQFWSQPSEILDLKSSNTNETLGHTPL